MTSSFPPFRFLDLPLELRMSVYTQIFSHSYLVLKVTEEICNASVIPSPLYISTTIRTSVDFSNLVSFEIAQTCRQIHTEINALAKKANRELVVYTENPLYLQRGISWSSHLPKSFIERLTTLQVITKTYPLPHFHEFIPRDFFPKLQTINFIVDVGCFRRRDVSQLQKPQAIILTTKELLEDRQLAQVGVSLKTRGFRRILQRSNRLRGRSLQTRVNIFAIVEMYTAGKAEDQEPSIAAISVEDQDTDGIIEWSEMAVEITECQMNRLAKRHRLAIEMSKALKDAKVSEVG